ncbi:hypothetical protein V6N12_017893 [Hibiscus sabdariffa]|uniref:Uncharacterized protein n=1 Tax=Hibiscus sabdariffa TaxID=183260 RepID=A0ABR2BKD0_9ROSI
MITQLWRLTRVWQCRHLPLNPRDMICMVRGWFIENRRHKGKDTTTVKQANGRLEGSHKVISIVEKGSSGKGLSGVKIAKLHGFANKNFKETSQQSSHINVQGMQESNKSQDSLQDNSKDEDFMDKEEVWETNDGSNPAEPQ